MPRTGRYDPFARGRFPVGVRTLQAMDTTRHRLFPCEVWYPAAAARSGPWPLILFSHASGHNRLESTFLCTHLSSHGYVVGALDHSDVVAAELARRAGETAAQNAARVASIIANRVPDIQFLLDHLLRSWGSDSDARLDADRIGIVGHSFGGWTALAAPDSERRIRAVVALAPGGASKPKPGILPLKLDFKWGRDVPTLYLVAENDASLPLSGMLELFDRTPSTKQMLILRRADHMHFMDAAEDAHEAFRTMRSTAEVARIQEEMLPIAELCTGEQAHLFVRGLTLGHMDATLKHMEEAQRFLTAEALENLAARGIDAFVHSP